MEGERERRERKRQRGRERERETTYIRVIGLRHCVRVGCGQSCEEKKREQREERAEKAHVEVLDNTNMSS